MQTTNNMSNRTDITASTPQERIQVRTSVKRRRPPQNPDLHRSIKRCLGVFTLLSAASMSFGANLYWKSDASGSDDFLAPANWSGAFTTSSDSLRVGGPITTYPYSANLARLTTGFGVETGAGDLNDALVVGGYLYQGNFELACGSDTTAYFRSVIVGDTKIDAAEGDSVMTITSGTIKNAPVAVDSGYLTVGRNNATGNSAYYGVGYLHINSGKVNMDRITVGELKAGYTFAGEGHIVLQNDGIIDLPCQKTFDPPSMVGLRVNNGDFTWNDNGNSAVTTGFMSVNTATLKFQSTDNSFGTDGKGIVIEGGKPAGDGSAVFTTDALIDVTGLVDTANWVTLITAAGGVSFTNTTLMTAVPATPLLTPASIAEGWGYRLLDLDGEAGNATALQVRIQPTLTCHAANGKLNLSWPAVYKGWTLQAQTNSPSAGLTTSWAGSDVTGSDLVTSIEMDINPANPSVFFRLRQ